MSARIDEATAEPTSPMAARVVRRAIRLIGGQSVPMGADLGLSSGPNPERTTDLDSDQLQRFQRQVDQRKAAVGRDFERSRRTGYAILREMRREIEEVDGILTLLHNFTFGVDPRQQQSLGEAAPLELMVNTRVRRSLRSALEDAWNDLEVPNVVPQMLDQGTQLGDSFLKLASTSVKMVRATALRPEDVDIMVAPDGDIAGYQVISGGRNGGLSNQGQGVILHPLYCVHYAHHLRFGNYYGTSLFDSAQSRGRKIMVLDDIIHVLCILQGAQRKTTSVEVGKEWTDATIDGWVARLKGYTGNFGFFDQSGKLHRALATMIDMADRIVPYRKGQAPPQYHNDPTPPFKDLLAIVANDRDLLYVAAQTPKALAGLLNDAAGTKSALVEQAVQFQKTIRNYKRDAVRLAMSILLRASIVAEQVPRSRDFVVRAGPPAELNDKLIAEAQKIRAETAKILGLERVGTEWVLLNVLNMDPEAASAMARELDDDAEPPAPDAPIDIEDPGGQEELARVRGELGDLRMVSEDLTKSLGVYAYLEDGRIKTS